MHHRCPLNSRCPLFRASVKGGSTVLNSDWSIYIPWGYIYTVGIYIYRGDIYIPWGYIHTVGIYIYNVGILYIPWRYIYRGDIYIPWEYTYIYRGNIYTMGIYISPSSTTFGTNGTPYSWPYTGAEGV